jgi:transcriptional regulator with XRE-family HTH domain
MITFEVLQSRLLAFVRLRIQNGEYTERGLARVMGISQPQLHNVLKGARSLHPALADRFLRKFGITPLDLLSNAEVAAAVGSRGMPDTPEEAEGTPRRWRKPAARAARLGRERIERVSGQT